MNAFSFTPDQIHAARAARQHLTPSTRGATERDYLRIVRELGPLRPPAYAFPGTPAVPFDRFQENELETAERVRRERRVFKGRFQHGHIAYVATDELALFASAFRRPFEPDEAALAVQDALEREGPLHRSDLAAASGVKGRELSAALQKLQRAFMVFEDQTETAWDNPWALLETEHAERLRNAPSVRDARREVMRRFTRAHVFASVAETRDWSGWPALECEVLLEELVSSGNLAKAYVEGWGEHYLAADFEELPLEPCVAILDPGDPLVTAQASYLKKDFPGMPVLKYVLVDGEIVGVVEGRWGIKAFDVTDVHVPARARSGPLREEILAKIRRHFPPPEQRVLKYGGVPLDAANP